MSGIAQVLHNLGYIVSGSDQHDSPVLQQLRTMGIRVFVGHDAAHIDGADVVVVSTAVVADNVEVQAARSRRIAVVPRASMLAELMRFKPGIAVGGTHGKTTTTSLIASVLARAGLDPTFVIGGRLNSAGSNAGLGRGDYIVVEADESDASFLNLSPVMAVVTNIDQDHMATYGHDFDKLKQAFVDFLHRMPFYGTAVLCTDDPAVRSIIPQLTCPMVSYGFDEDAQFRAIDVRAQGGQMYCTVLRTVEGASSRLDVVLNLPGKHNVLNALAAIAVASELGLADEAVLDALASFTGVARRFQRHGALPVAAKGSSDCSVGSVAGTFELIEDYGHHPSEIAATLEAARGAFPGRRVVLVFQPHRYSRTRDCFDDFVKVLSRADTLVLCEVYAAGEAPIVAADGRSLARALRVAGHVEPLFVDDMADLPQAILDAVEPDDIVLCMGAGSIGSACPRLVELAHRHAGTEGQA